MDNVEIAKQKELSFHAGFEAARVEYEKKIERTKQFFQSELVSARAKVFDLECNQHEERRDRKIVLTTCLSYKNHISDIYKVMRAGTGPNLNLYGGGDCDGLEKNAKKNLKQIDEYINKLRHRNFEKLRNITQQSEKKVKNSGWIYFLSGVATGAAFTIIFKYFL